MSYFSDIPYSEEPDNKNVVEKDGVGLFDVENAKRFKCNNYPYYAKCSISEQSHTRWYAGRYNWYKQWLISREALKMRLYPINSEK